MLPFLKNKMEASVSIPADAEVRESDNENKDFDSLEVAAQDMLDAIASKNAGSLASALRAAFELCESEPHEEASRNG